MEYNIEKLPLDKLLIFDNGKYVIKRTVELKDSHRGNRPTEMVTVIELGKSDDAFSYVTGRVVGIPGANNNCFKIVDLNEDEHQYSIAFPIREPDATEWYEISKRIPGCSIIPISNSDNIEKVHKINN